MNDIERKIVATRLRTSAECIKIAALAIENGDVRGAKKELAEGAMHLNDAAVVLTLAGG